MPEVVTKRVKDLVHGDVTADYGAVTHREGRKVWFENRVVTFSSVEEELRLATDAGRR
jgi:hypothetical protein